MTKKRATMAARLSGLTAALYREIYDLTPRQRTAALRALDGLTTTNCSWILYRMREPLRDLVDCASSNRERAARLRVRSLRRSP